MRYKLIFTTTICLLFLINFISAVPKIEPYVNDFTHSLTSEQARELNLLADNIEQNTSWEIAMVIVPDTEGLDRLDYANKLGDENGVGKKDKDNGIVVLWSEGADRGIAIATGRYSESIFNDAKVGRIARAARPYFDNEQYYEGLKNITLELQKEIKGENIEIESSEDFDITLIFILAIIGVVFFIILIGSLTDSFDGSYSSSSSSSGSSSSVFSGSSGGSFGGSFGGGSFGGGGARG